MRVANMNVISATLTQALSFIDGIIGNYGVSVIVFTLLVRLVLLPLDIKSKKSTRAMERVKPQLDYINKKYAQDKEKLNQKTMELYQKEKISPLAGCLPMLIQLPILFCMFTAMRVVANEKTVEMIMGMMNGVAPQFDSFLWIKNIFQPDSLGATILPSYERAISYIQTAKLDFVAPEELQAIYNAYLTANYGVNQFMTLRILLFNITVPTTWTALTAYSNGLFILPLFAGLSQVFMTRLTGMQQPQPAASNDPNAAAANNMANGAMMKWFFPLFSLYICATQNAAFSIYWAVANIIAIVQQICISKYFDHQDKLAAAKAETSEE